MHNSNGRSFFTAGVDGPTLFSPESIEDDRELSRSVRYRRRNQQLERENSRLIEENEALRDRIGTLEGAVEFQRKVIERKSRGVL